MAKKAKKAKKAKAKKAKKSKKKWILARVECSAPPGLPTPGAILENGGPSVRLFHSCTRERVAWMERSAIRDCRSGMIIPDCASLYPGYGW